MESSTPVLPLPTPVLQSITVRNSPKKTPEEIKKLSTNRQAGEEYEGQWQKFFKLSTENFFYERIIFDKNKEPLLEVD